LPRELLLSLQQLESGWEPLFTSSGLVLRQGASPKVLQCPSTPAAGFGNSSSDMFLDPYAIIKCIRNEIVD
jgi:hypothetical protein